MEYNENTQIPKKGAVRKMPTISLSKVFSGEYLRIITNYSHTIQHVVNSYDVVIFMARKAICFYQSMVDNEIISPANCEVVSSRVLDYNVIARFKNQKVAIVDDVVVKGRSLEKVLSEFDKHNIAADIYVAACEKKIATKLLNNPLHRVSPKFVYLDSSEIYLFSGLITEYIELSMCPLNIDQPIYECSHNIKDTLSALKELPALNITSGLQKKYGITSKVIYFKYCYFDDLMISGILKKSILKIRFLYNSYKIIALPFVLFPEITNEELNSLYLYLDLEQSKDLFYSDNDNLYYENKLKIVSSFFSDLLFRDFIAHNHFNRCYHIDYFQFYCNTNQIFGRRLESLLSRFDARKLTIIDINFDAFCFPEYIGHAINSISTINIHDQHYFNSINTKIDDIVITFDYLRDKLLVNNIQWYVVSSIFDVLIDRGMIVPSVVHSTSGIVRAYKLGEYSKLTRTQLESFVGMLYKYQTLTNSDIGKIEFEKLCVLFFTQGIHRRIFDQQTEYEDDCYGVCYSLYGPRVSDSDKVYKVDSDSALITDFLENELIQERNKVYHINPLYIQDQNKDLKNFADTFALQYSKLKELFESVKREEKENRNRGIYKTLWNQYVHTYNQYLTLHAIGNSKKNQFLSLCAELYQVMLMDETIFEFKNTNRRRYNKIISGINSGLWKYFCYKNDALNKTNIDICEKDVNVAAIIGSASTPVREDRNPALDKIIDEAGKLLYTVSFFINNVATVLNKISYFADSVNMESELAGDVTDTSKIIFSSYYYKLFKDERHSIETEIQTLVTSEQRILLFSKKLEDFKRKCRFVLDYCELYLVSETPQYDCFKKMIVLYAPSRNLPANIDNTTEVFLDKVTSDSMCKVYILPDREIANTILTKILQQTFDLEEISYIVLDMKSREEGAVQICDQCRGTFLSKLIREEINQIRNRPTGPAPKMTFIKNIAIGDFKRNNYEFIKIQEENISYGYVRTTLDIIAH